MVERERERERAERERAGVRYESEYAQELNERSRRQLDQDFPRDRGAQSRPKVGRGIHGRMCRMDTDRLRDRDRDRGRDRGTETRVETRRSRDRSRERASVGDGDRFASASSGAG